MNKKRWMIIALLAALLLTGCATAPPAWPGLTAADQVAYLANGAQVFAINADTGVELWHYPQRPSARQLFYAAPVLTSDGLVIVGSAGSEHSLVAIDPSKFPTEVPPPLGWFGNFLCSIGLAQTNCPVEIHAEAWTFSAAKDHWIASPLIVGDLLFAPNSDGNLYVLDLADGVVNKTALAVLPLGGHLWGTPITDGERVFVTSLDHMVFAVDVASLETIWSEDLGAAIPGSPVFGPDGMLYITSFSSKLERLDPATGEHNAVVETETWVWNGPTVAGETLYFGDVAGNFYSFDLAAGQLTWAPIKLDNAITAGALVIEDLVLVATESGDVYEVDTAGQSKIWSAAEGSVYTSPVIAGDLILVAPTQANRYLAAFDRSGHLKWQFPPGE